uniref:Myeloid/lymphoid or mixed-lineage leukemia 3 n=2 Tax=Nothobranchius TaxID=28779 RepID=A0A1A8KTX1_NOTKU
MFCLFVVFICPWQLGSPLVINKANLKEGEWHLQRTQVCSGVRVYGAPPLILFWKVFKNLENLLKVMMTCLRTPVCALLKGLGLYATRDIEKCTMVIEYIGTIIRSEVANRKERLYESQNRGVYMFRIDNDYVIDATITGGPARYINHSCAPNCITEVVTVERENKIIISSCRRIQRGEELCYDYKFDLEDDQHKIPCHCGAMNCRKWMN